MTSIVTSILSSTGGLLWNKARDSAAAKLKDGDLMDATICELSSFLQQGVDLLCISLNKSKLEQKAVIQPTQQDRGETSRMSSGGGGVESTLNEILELPHAMGEVKIYSDKEFESAKEMFKDARKRATHAVFNEALNINNRIFAAKLRVISEILEFFDCPEKAITGCLSFLQDLHSRLPAIREIFSAYLSRAKSLFGNENRSRGRRVEAVKSVMLINYLLYQFNLKFSSRKLTDKFIWPVTIQLDNGRNFNPILDWREIATRKSMGDELSQLRDPYKLMLDEKVIPVLSAMNNRKLVVVEEKGDEIGNNE